SVAVGKVDKGHQSGDRLPVGKPFPLVHILFLDENGEDKSNFLFPAPIKLEKKAKDYLDDTTTPGVRALSARERIRLMGFPDTFKQVVSDAQLSKQSGNSIVVSVMEALYRQMDITKYGVAA
ncbi:MAG: DNA cytosine methyltransferase, partial [Spirochaetia bacterium]|nr:DNA cytosine methyltransferase [Spirochaetia bacterium]